VFEHALLYPIENKRIMLKVTECLEIKSRFNENIHTLGYFFLTNHIKTASIESIDQKKVVMTLGEKKKLRAFYFFFWVFSF
jgi:hypothetical protein